MQIGFLHQPGPENHRNQSRLLIAKAQSVLRFQPLQHRAGGAHQARIELIDLCRQCVINANAEQAAIQRLGEVDIELIGQTLFVAEMHTGELMEVGNHLADGQAQAVILLMIVMARIGRAHQHKEQG